jgi:hypothetical protein
MVTYFAKFKAEEREFKANLEVVALSEEKKDLFTKVKRPPYMFVI